MHLYLSSIGEDDLAPGAFAGVRITDTTLDITEGHRDSLGQLTQFTSTHGGTARARFVLRPDNWFLFEELSELCAQLQVSLELRLIGQRGEVPMDGLSTSDLELVNAVLARTWPRCGGTHHPTSLPDFALDHLCEQFRALLERRSRLPEALKNSGLQLLLPPLDHPWFLDERFFEWWFETLLTHASHPRVTDWLRGLATNGSAQTNLHRLPQLRVLLQRALITGEVSEAEGALRSVYAPPGVFEALAKEDAEAARRVDLKRFGGPWATQAGLARTAARKRPFKVVKATPPTQGPASITVLIPSYRHERFIVEAMRSVLVQRDVALKLVVVDDQSSDQTVARANSVRDPRVEVRLNPKNLGLGNSVLEALATVDTPYVAILNSDDVFHPDRLSKCVRALENKAEAQLVTTGLHLVDANGGGLTPQNVSRVLDGKLIHDWVHWFHRTSPVEPISDATCFSELLERNFLVTSSNVVARTGWLLSQAAFLKSLKYCLDWWLFLEAARKGHLLHLPDRLLAYRLHESNTVWFDEERRFSYYLEVHRVAAAALRLRTESTTGVAQMDLTSIVSDVCSHAASNTEVDGFGLFLNTLLDPLQLESAAELDEGVRQAVKHLDHEAKRHRNCAARDGHSALQDRGRFESLKEELLLNERHTRRWLQLYLDDVEKRLAQCWEDRHAIEARLAQIDLDRTASLEQLNRSIAELEELRTRNTELGTEIARLQDNNELLRTRSAYLEEHTEHWRGRSQELQSDLAELRASLAAFDGITKLLQGELAEARAARDSAQARITEVERLLNSMAERAAQAAALSHADLMQRDAELRGTRGDLAASRIELSTLQAMLDVSRVECALREARISSLSQELSTRNQELHRLADSREWRWGNFLWNKMPLGYLSRRGKKWYRRLVDAKDRALMLFKRRNRAQGTAVVTACWQWPIYSHTFVYQEMIGLTHMGLDVRLFHWELGETAQLHKAFGYLADHRTQLQPVWENHLRDKAHFDKTKPGRLRSFLERVAAVTGRSVEDLEKEPTVLQGCTFARMAELAGADYLHSYFFYDQSFMAMQAAWLLELPRGVSCYADHMLQDYPFKLVPLQVELSDVIVATSARIKRELSQMTGGRFDDKIVVKPNGVDGARFPPVVRQDRKPGDPFEVVSISRIEPKKGLTHLVEAVAMLKQRGHKVKAHVVGSKDPHSKGSLEYAAEFEALIEKLGVKDEVILHGMKKQEELPPILQRCRAFVAPYVEMGSGDKDGIPTAMLEGLASGLPVVTTDSGSILEVVTTEVEGIVVPQRDSKAFAAALERLIAEPALERRMAKAARDRFDREFDIRVTEVRLHERVAGLVNKRQRTHGKGKSQQPAN